MRPVRVALAKVFSRPRYRVIAIAGGLGIAALYWFLVTRTSSLTMMVQMSGWADTAGRLALTLLVAALFGTNLAFLLYKRDTKASTGTFLGTVAGAFAAGCPACGAILLSLIGVTSGFAAFPLRGFEIQLASVAILSAVMFYAARGIAGSGCQRCRV